MALMRETPVVKAIVRLAISLETIKHIDKSIRVKIRTEGEDRIHRIEIELEGEKPLLVVEPL
ncbi:MAG: hypothetical protein QW057_08315 [Candidatus Bathyarchaeia archaeon]